MIYYLSVSGQLINIYMVNPDYFSNVCYMVTVGLHGISSD